jgi:hypothetical protein
MSEALDDGTDNGVREQDKFLPTANIARIMYDFLALPGRGRSVGVSSRHQT